VGETVNGTPIANLAPIRPDAAGVTCRSVNAAAEPRWMSEVRLRAARRVLWLRQLWSEHQYGNEHLLAISHSEVDRALGPRAEARAAEQEFYRSDERARELGAQLAALAGRPEDARFEHVVDTLGLGPLDTAIFMLAVAAAAEPAIGRVLGYLLDATGAIDPTPSLAATLFELTAEDPPGPDSALVRWLLAGPVASGPEAFALSTGWRADALMLPALLGRSSVPDATGWSAGVIGRAVTPPPGPVLQAEAAEEITSFVRSLGQDGQAGLPIEIELIGAPGSGRTTLAAHVAARLGTRLVAVNVAELASRPDPLAAAIREVRSARLGGSVIAWENAQALPDESWAAVPAQPLTFLSFRVPPAGAAGCRAIRRSVRCETIGRGDRIRLWASLAATPAPAAVADWSLRPAEIGVAARVAPAGDHEVAEVCRRLLLADTPDLASPLPLPFRWPDLVLPAATEAHLREFEVQAARRGRVLDDWGFSRLTSLGRGTTALFAGPSGTGKTMAAQVVARSIGLDLYRVDLAGVVSKYIGETEKRLRELFEACERAPVLLLFDEADALFGKRTQVSDAHDRYANIEIDYVLQRMEQFDGVAVLTTNRKGDLDTAFTRRIRFVIDFAPPDPGARERLWRIALEDARDAAGRPLVDRLDWCRLGREVDLTGAGIKSAALAAAFLASRDGGLIAERHVLAAARRELEKQGVVVRAGQLEPR
jgi:hypothetical protein